MYELVDISLADVEYLQEHALERISAIRIGLLDMGLQPFACDEFRGYGAEYHPAKQTLVIVKEESGKVVIATKDPFTQLVRDAYAEVLQGARAPRTRQSSKKA